MVEYPIQIRWPYKPPVHRAMNSRETLRWFGYCFFFGGASADYIRAYIAFERFRKNNNSLYDNSVVVKGA